MTTTGRTSTKMKSGSSSSPPSKTGSGGQQALDILLVIWEFILLILKILLFTAEALFRLVVPVSEKSVKGEVVVITGAGHGIGKELCLQYASQGATVVCWDVNDKTNQETVKEISRLGYPKAHAYICDVTNREAVLELAKKVQKEVGDVGILINNAGIMPCHPFLEHTEKEIERIININVMAHFWTLQAFLPSMVRNNHGHIVALSSCAGIMGIRNLVPYCASKYAVRGMMESLFCDLRTNPNNKVQLTLIYPYMVDTGLCVRPKVRFPSLLPVLKQKEVANYIMTAQRRNIFETTVPRSLLSLTYLMRLCPLKVGLLLSDFLESYPESDK